MVMVLCGQGTMRVLSNGMGQQGGGKRRALFLLLVMLMSVGFVCFEVGKEIGMSISLR